MELDRVSAENILKMLAPFVIEATSTSDMGVDFSAATPNGIIYPEPGMLLDYIDCNGEYHGDWPPHTWNAKSEQDFSCLMKTFLLNDYWRVTPWRSIGDEEVFALVNFVSGPDFHRLNSYDPS